MTKARGEQNSMLQSMEVHDTWARHFRTRENDRFFGLAFDFVAQCFGPPTDDPVVDVGCGSGTKSLHLVRRGYRVLGLDFAEIILEEARRAAAAAGLAERVRFQQGDLTALHLPSESVHGVVCWGVLMHVPAIETAVAELARVLAPGGKLIVSEGNLRSIQAVSLRWLKRLLRRERAEVARTAAGIEFWEETDSGRLMTRQGDIPWLIAEFQRLGLKLVQRRAGQFSEIYTLLPWKPLRSLVHAFNNFWFRWIRFGGPAYGNVLTFVKD